MTEKFAGVSLDEAIIMGVINLSPETFYKGSLAQGKEEVSSRVEGDDRGRSPNHRPGRDVHGTDRGTDHRRRGEGEVASGGRGREGR